MSLWRELVKTRFGGLHDSNDDKVLPLAEAIQTFVRPRMKINPCSLLSRPCAAVYELSRQFAGKDPQWEFISSSMGGTYLALVHLGLVKKIIVSFAGEGYPTPGPSPVIWNALASKKMQLENWTMLTIPQRLLAGAMGVPFFPTRSLAGSSIGEEAKREGNFAEIEDPFGSGNKVGVLRAYQPDISFIHVWAADPAGNSICFPPYAENIYGAMAAKEGVVVTADHIVSTEFIRKYSNLGRIPAAIVRSVSHCPYGAHPTGNFSQNIPELVPYANDYEFMKVNRKATKDSKSFDAWLKEWVFDVKDHDGYIKKLGQERIDKLHFLATPESWNEELEWMSKQLDEARPASPIETMIVQASHAMAGRVREHGYKTCLSGVGQAGLAAWLAQDRLLKEDIELTMMAEIGIYGHDPRPADPFVFNYRNLPTTTTLCDIFETLGLHTSGANNACLGAIGAGQIDRHGNVNSTRIGPLHLVGSGGANDIASAAVETVVIVQQRKEAFLERVDYVTSPGRNVRCVVSTMGRYEKNETGDLVLTGYFGFSGADASTAAEEIKARCGWNLQVSDNLERLDEASDYELALLRMFDPERLFLGKATEKVKAAVGV